MERDFEPRSRLRSLSTVFVALWLVGAAGLPAANRAVGQDQFGHKSVAVEDVCPDIHVRAGETVPIDCSLAFEPESEFEWTSPDALALALLRETQAGAARFTAPAGLRQSETYTFHRIRIGVAGNVLGRTEIRVVAHPAWTPDCRDLDGSPLKGRARLACSEISAEGVPDAPEFHAVRTELQPVPALSREWQPEPPDLRCVRSVTVEAAGEASVSCLGAGSEPGLLQYTARFDWPPYSETVVLEGGDFEYVLRAPANEDAAAVRRLELTVEDLATGLAASQDIEVHVVNAGPVLRCYDLVVQEGDRVRIPCMASGRAGTRYQLLWPGRPNGMPGACSKRCRPSRRRTWKGHYAHRFGSRPGSERGTGCAAGNQRNGS